MVEHIDAHDHAGRDQPIGEPPVFAARFRIAGGVIVEEHDGGGPSRRGFPEDFPWMHDARVECADRKHCGPHDSMLRIEQHDSELLDSTIPVLDHEEFGHGARARHLQTLATAARDHAAAQFDGREHLRGACAADSSNVNEILQSRARESFRAADGGQQRVGEIEGARSGLSLTKHDRDEFVVAKRGRAKPRKLLTRTIVRRNGLHRTPSLLYCRPMRRLVRLRRARRMLATAPPLCCLLLFCAACSEPPQKEIDRAQGAIDAARAAGADQYAPGAYKAATDALQQAHEAVEQRDYRLALSRALDANERALEAAKEGANGKARARSEVEGLLAMASNSVQQLQTKLRSAEAVRLPNLEGSRKLRADAQRALQEARTAVKEGNYLQAMERIKSFPDRIAAEIKAIDETMEAKGARGGRRRR